MSFFDDPTVKDFMIQVVKRSIGIIDNWINVHYHLDKAVICPDCKKKLIIGKDVELVRSK